MAEPHILRKDTLLPSTRLLRAGSLLTHFVAASLSHAGGGIIGTRTGGEFATPAPSSGGVGFGALAQMILALAIVAFLLKWVLPKVAGKVSKKLVTTADSGIRVEESAQFAGGSLYIVSARGKSILISVTGTQVTTLTELDSVPKPIKDPFEQVLEAAQAMPTPTSAELEARAALDRLAHLTEAHGQ